MRALPRIMVIDDDLDILYIVRRSLEKWGYDVDTFSNPRYALQQFRQCPNRYAVVLTDIQMPEMNGIVLANSMKKVKPDAKIIIMTAFEIVSEDLRLTLPSIKQKDVLQKPFTLAQVCQAINGQLQAA